ncbi:MAG: radical SAM protein [Chitinophagales bacterium]
MKEQIVNLLSKINSTARKQSGPGLPAKTVAEYNAARKKPNSTHICHAPFSNMYFNVHGDCAPCWLTFLDPDSYPEKSVREIWFGEKFQTLRNKLKNYDLTHKCNVCLKNLQTGNHTSVLARAYDINKIKEYPTMMELEVANTCNLECVMCIGELSSSIRKNRENLPPLESPYDDKFADQLEEFIPHLEEIRFNGGEPFLIPLVYTLFEKIEKLNPGLKIVIATNGTIYNNKVKSWLNRLNIHINLSLDSLTADIYEEVRVNAQFKRVMENFEHFREYTKTNNRTMCIMVNPMRNNWHEMPEFVRFVNKHNLNLWFNTIHRPADWSIWALPANELKEVYETLSKVEFESEYNYSSITTYNIGLYDNLVNVQIKNWWKEAEEREKIEKIKESNPAPVDAKSAVMKKLNNFIYTHFNEGEEQKKQKLTLIDEKLNHINEVLKDRNGEVDFYTLILESPTGDLYTKLESKSVNSLVEDFENWFLQKNAAGQ